MENQKHITVFLDRDGVINRDSSDYVKSWDEFHFLEGSIEAINLLTMAGFRIIIITNQSIISRQMVSPKVLEDIFSRMTRKIEDGGGSLTDIFFCPHKPEDCCDCRKPKPGMILEAQKKYKISLSSAFMVGDSAKDVETAINAGIGKTILVKTGNGVVAEKVLSEKKIFPDYIAENLLHGVKWIIEENQKATQG